MDIPDVLTVVGLGLDIGGIVLLFVVAPEKKPYPLKPGYWAPDNAEELVECWEEDQKKDYGGQESALV